MESHTLLGRSIAKRALHAADLVTGNDPSLLKRAVELGVPQERTVLVHLGIDRVFLEAGEQSVNLHPPPGDERVVISTRAHEPLYNLDVVLRAFAMARTQVPGAKLVVAGTGSQQGKLQQIARELSLGDAVQFMGQQSSTRLADLLAAAHVYVSVPVLRLAGAKQPGGDGGRCVPDRQRPAQHGRLDSPRHDRPARSAGLRS